MRSPVRYFRRAALWFILFCWCFPGRLSAAGYLTNAVQIRALSVSEAAATLPVHLHGVMISSAAPLPAPNGGHDRTHAALVIFDSTASIYIAGSTNVLSGFREGDMLEVEGVTDPGQFAPFVRAKAVRKVGSAPIPPPQPATYQTLITGGLDAQLVEVTGIVRSWSPLNTNELFGSWMLVLAVDGNKVTATATGVHPADLEPDAEVRIRCICFYQFNQQRQVLNPALVMPENSPVTVTRAAPANPFGSPIRPLASMFLFGTNNSLGHRIHLRGTVTYQQSPEMLWIRDESGAGGIQTLPAISLTAGDLVDVLGFTHYGAAAAAPGSAVLGDAIIRRAAPGDVPVPLYLAGFAEAFKHDADLVSLDGILADAEPILGGAVLDFDLGGKSFQAVIKSSQTPPVLRSLKPGSRIRVTGICSVISDDSNFVLSGVWHPQSFQILLRSPADLFLLQSPPWWTPGHIIFLLGLATISLLGLIGALAMLARHRLKEQQRQRAMAEAEFTAILAERNRVAREIHDTLAQGLAATSVQLRLAKKSAGDASETLAHHLDFALQLVSGCLKEARNTIWNMRSQVLEENDLAGALKEVLNQLVDGSTVETSFDVAGRTRRFAPIIESNLLRLGQEAISNAVKHARATRIQVSLNFDEKQFLLEIADNGKGFNPDHPPASAGGFGLVGMRERAASLNGQLSIQSDIHRGTCVKFRLPLSGE